MVECIFYPRATFSTRNDLKLLYAYNARVMYVVGKVIIRVRVGAEDGPRRSKRKPVAYTRHQPGRSLCRGFAADRSTTVSGADPRTLPTAHARACPSVVPRGR